ncbi:MAG: helix-turn-helix transcriptional regulator [Terriglobales bacterium]|jgi:transcriptional regulator with XRE-family HTH domain
MRWHPLPSALRHRSKNLAPDLKSIGRRIREIRGFDHTQREFGKMLGIGQTQLSKYEKGQSAPTLELLLKLKSYSGRSLDWIVTGGEGE